MFLIGAATILRTRRDDTLDGLTAMAFVLTAAILIGRPVVSYIYEGPLQEEAQVAGSLWIVSFKIFAILSWFATAILFLLRVTSDLMEELSTQSLTDPLTGIANRRGGGQRIADHALRPAGADGYGRRPVRVRLYPQRRQPNHAVASDRTRLARTRWWRSGGNGLCRGRPDLPAPVYRARDGGRFDPLGQSPFSRLWRAAVSGWRGHSFSGERLRLLTQTRSSEFPGRSPRYRGLATPSARPMSGSWRMLRACCPWRRSQTPRRLPDGSSCHAYPSRQSG